jgi:cystathionine beta-lyase
MSEEEFILRRSAFLETCHEETKRIHESIIDPRASNGALNPAGLGEAAGFSMGPNLAWGQSTIAFAGCERYFRARDGGEGYQGSAEYGVVRTAESALVCRKLSELHGGAGAIFLSSGLAALSAVFLTFPEDRGSVILLPESCYYPTGRLLREGLKLDVRLYPSDANGEALEKILWDLKKEGRKPGLVFIEAPGTHTFEIPEIDEIVAVAKKHGLKTVMDNTWSSHVRFRPLEHGIDIAVQATTKYETGYGDTPSGAVIASSEEDYQRLSYTARIYGVGAVDLPTCRRLLGRIESAKERMDRHYAAALKVIDWFQKQDFTAQILCPFVETSPFYKRYLKYFGGGNGMFSVILNEKYNEGTAHDFVDVCPLPLVGESWAGHVTLMLPVRPLRNFTPLPKGPKIRISIGLEYPEDIIRSFSTASQLL